MGTIPSSIDVEKDIVNGFLIRYGIVKEFSQMKDKKYKIPNGTWQFIMMEEDLKRNPLPEGVMIGNACVDFIQAVIKMSQVQ